ncbi:ral guanine nucleotide dissociation stimulator-like isoform X1 [Diceros bicornis minor]|uniref:ral guanine nucleotide dissociation stimulator-like isoform X1 n=1 Tax=Diceros bicornis minor TaxID=77932 RepID=UPI0026F0B0E1|nr:ral guanine nucleotide dissociation stimulator-like isoform X1 [Diceros bicornis minor]
MDVECEILKNFSSLRAVISGLQKTSISHLKNMWADVSRESSEKLKELYSHDKSLRRELMTKVEWRLEVWKERRGEGERGTGQAVVLIVSHLNVL